jgi:hypothetical protein
VFLSAKGPRAPSVDPELESDAEVPPALALSVAPTPPQPPSVPVSQAPSSSTLPLVEPRAEIPPLSAPLPSAEQKVVTPPPLTLDIPGSGEASAVVSSSQTTAPLEVSTVTSSSVNPAPVPVLDVSMPDTPSSNPFAGVELPVAAPEPAAPPKPRRTRAKKSAATVKDSDDGIEIIDQGPVKRKSEGGSSAQPSSSK